MDIIIGQWIAFDYGGGLQPRKIVGVIDRDFDRVLAIIERPEGFNIEDLNVTDFTFFPSEAACLAAIPSLLAADEEVTV